MNDVELIKSKIDIADFISQYIQLKKAGRSYKALCPFHSEKTPSFIVSPERQSWHCFGACSMGGDVVTFLEKWEGIDFVEALRDLAKRSGVTLSKFTPTKDSALKTKLYEINHLTSEFYHYLLKSHKIGKRALEYLKERRIRDEIIDTFSLGYAPESWDSLFNFLEKKGYHPDDIFSSGMVIRSESRRIYDRFRGRLMFTLKDQRGNIIGFSGRKLPGSDETQAKYINTPETPLYIKGSTLYGLDVTKETIKKQKEAIIVEGEFDFLASYQAGVTNIVAIKGSALTENQTLLLKRYSDNLLLSLDSDFAGNEAARKGIEIAENAGLVVKVVTLDYGKDPAECIDKSPSLWKKSIEKSVPVYDFIIDSALRKYDKSDVIGKKKISEEITPFISKIQNPIVASHYIKKIAGELKVSEESIDTALDLYQKKQKVKDVDHIAANTKYQRKELLEMHLLSLIIQSDKPQEVIEQVQKDLTIDDLESSPIKEIIGFLVSYLKKHKKLDFKEINPAITAELSPTFDRAYLTDLSQVLKNEKLFHKELSQTAKEIKKLSTRRKINQLSTKIRQAEEEGKTEEVTLINKQIRLLLKELNQLEK